MNVTNEERMVPRSGNGCECDGLNNITIPLCVEDREEVRMAAMDARMNRMGRKKYGYKN